MPSGTSFLDELRRRGVARAALIYGAAAFAVLEFADIAFPRLGLPDGAVNVVLWAGILGFPPALLASWAVELRAEPDRARLRSWLSPATMGIAAALVVLGAAMGMLWGGGDPLGVGSDDEVERRSVAILPFENTSRDAANEPFVIGIHDDLVSQISRISSIKTISRTSVLQYRDTTMTIPEIARDLGVATILEGAVQRSGDRVRLNVQLIDAASDEHVWSETYDRQLTAVDIFAIQSEIATSVAEALRATLSSEEERRLGTAPTESLEAVESYFLGKQLLERRTKESLAAAVEYFDQVIELDPEYALGHSGLADAYMILPEYEPSIDSQLARKKSEAAARQALELDPDLPEALTSMGWSRLIHYYEWDEAERLLRRALEVQPHNAGALHWLSHLLSWQGRHTEALEYARRAVDVDPNSRLMLMNLSYMLMDAGQFQAAIDLARTNLRDRPDYFEQHGNLWLTYMRAGRAAEGAEALEGWAALTRRDVAAVRDIGRAFERYAETGEPQPLPAALLERAAFGSEDLGQVHAFVGDGARALDALERALDERSGSRSVLSMKVNPAFDFIRDEPRFQSLLGKLGLAGG